MPFVLDASVAVAWAFEDESSIFAQDILQALETDEARVPVIWPLEVSNALLTAERRGRIRPADTARFITLLRALPIVIEDTGGEPVTEVLLDLARAYDLSTYDASYLELAMRDGLSLVTQDERMRAAAGKAGVALAV